MERPQRTGCASPSSGFITTLLLRPDGYGQRRIIFMRGTLSTVQVLGAQQIEAGQLSIIVSSAGRLRNVHFPESGRHSGPGGCSRFEATGR